MNKIFFVIFVISIFAQSEPVIAADSLNEDFDNATRRLANLIRDDDETIELTAAPIMLSANCEFRRQWWSERCGSIEALVPFSTSGPGSAVWNYVALFRILPQTPEISARGSRGRRKRVSLITYAFIPEQIGLIDWETAHIEVGHAVFQTRHWAEADSHSNPTRLGSVRIDLDGGLEITNIP